MSRYVRIVIQLPADMKRQLDVLRSEGYSASGFIRALLERELAIRRAHQTDESDHFLSDTSKKHLNY